MSFSSLASRISSLPTIIAGPILRRVEKDSVTVWFASKQALVDVVLEVRDTAGSVMFFSPSSATIRFGKKLHLLTITATTGAFSPLSSGSTYLYDIVFGSLNEKRLASPGILLNTSEDFRANFCYEPFHLPSFRIPSDVSNLKFVHGSCRKPHGGETDALRALDVMLEGHADDNERPEMLMLTGDQIYADDVSDTLLYMLMDASETLLDWESSEQLPDSPTADQLKPGHRQDTVASDPDDVSAGQLSSGYAKSHLITLGEFYSMYLFAWSNALWPAESDFPVFEDVYEGAERSRTYHLKYTTSTSRTEEYQTYLNETFALKAFLKSLPFVRRSLANIPTYMMFDDHEVTDDWFITREWTEYTLRDNTLSRRILQNGIAAYAVFQGWGNTPSVFQSGEGAALLALMSSLESETGSLNAIFNNIGDKVLPALQNRGRELSGSLIDWHYNIEFDDFRLVAIDPRTQRGFPSDDGFPALLSGTGISEQLTNRNDSKSVTILISPAPVFGDINIEALQRLSQRFQGMYAKDQEAWGFNHAAFETFLHHLASYGKVVVLSGDVHYSFSVAVQYWNERRTGTPRASMAQLCCSSFKNSDSDTNSTDSWYLRPPSQTVRYITWPTTDSHYSQRTGGVGGTTTNFTVRVEANEPIRWNNDKSILTGSTHQPQSRYQLDYARDTRLASVRPGSISHGTSGSTAQQRAGYIQRNRAENGHRTVVGRDTIGVVTFNWPEKKVTHTFWIVPGGLTTRATDSTLLQPYTIHEVSLQVPSSTDPRPGD